MDDQIALLDVPPAAAPCRASPSVPPSIHAPSSEWFRAGSTTPFRHAASVQRGLHPFGLPLSTWPGASCGNCAHVAKNEMRSGKVFHKCGLDQASWTAGPGTDLRLKWRGCRRWAPPAADPQRLEPVSITRADPAGPITRESVVEHAILMRPRIDPLVAGVLMTAEEACPSLGWAEVALERWRAVVLAGALEPGPAADLLLAGIRCALGAQ